MAKGSRVFSFRIDAGDWERLEAATADLKMSPKEILVEALRSYLEDRLRNGVVTIEVKTKKGVLKVARWGGAGQINLAVGGSLLGRGRGITDSALQSAVSALAQAMAEQLSRV